MKKVHGKMNGILHIYWTKKTSTNSGKI